MHGGSYRGQVHVTLILTCTKKPKKHAGKYALFQNLIKSKG